MKKYSKKLFIEILILLACVNILVMLAGNEPAEDTAYLNYHINSDKMLLLETFYSDSETIDGNQISMYTMTETSQDANFQIDINAEYLRIDLGKEAGEMTLSDISLSASGQEIMLNPQELQKKLVTSQQITEIVFEDSGIHVKTEGDDPFLLFDISDIHMSETIQELQIKQLQKERIEVCIVLDAVVLLIFLLFPGVFTTPYEVIQNRSLLIRLAQNDFITRYAGSYFGLLWAFVQPCVTIVLYWFVFQVGLGAGPVDGYPFVVWLVAGLVPWLFFQDAVLYGTNSLIEYSYLVKKVVFEVDILPMVKILSAFFVHVVFLGISVLLFSVLGCFPGWFCLQMIYYSICAGVFAIALSYCTSAIVLFFRDLGQIINIFLQIGTWLTPIMWQISIIPQGYQWIFKLNPMFYVVQGYRDCVMDKIWFWERLGDTVYFWIVIMILFVCGNGIFQRLKPHFADVL